VQFLEIFEFLPSPISYWYLKIFFNRMTPIFNVINHSWQSTKNVILAHGLLSNETPTTKSTTVQCHKNNWIYLTSTYYWWLLRPTITIWFNLKL